MESKKLKVGIVGGTGYTGVELLRLLSIHPHITLTTITSRGEAGLPCGRYVSKFYVAMLILLLVTQPLQI